MTISINLGMLASGPQSKLIYALAEACLADTAVLAIWVGGSLAEGRGDAYSDIDFRIAVEASQLASWRHPKWDHYLPLAVCGGTFLKFSDHSFLHHLILEDGTILDFYVQDTSVTLAEPSIVVLACRDEDFRRAIEAFSRAPAAMVQEIEAESARQLLIDYWIVTHKQLKGLARRFDYTSFVGLYFERVALLRALFMEVTGKSLEARVSIHMIGALHQGLQGALTEQQQALLGLPSRTPEETILAIEAVRAEMRRVGKSLALQYGFTYPQALEDVVQKTWQEKKQNLAKR